MTLREKLWVIVHWIGGLFLAAIQVVIAYYFLGRWGAIAAIAYTVWALWRSFGIALEQFANAIRADERENNNADH